MTALLALGLLLNLLVLADGGLGPAQRRALVPLLLAALPGLLLGAGLLAWLSKPALQIAVGVAVIVAVAVQWQARARGRADAASGGPSRERRPSGARAATGRGSPRPSSASPAVR